MANRLADAISPYLRAHAQNPVDWYPWGADAFAEASRRGLPLLISIGYSTCHWCHVMARESFSDPVLAASLNERFVAVKVDREEHPDVDASYLAAASAFTSNLGWPLTVFVTPEGRTFFAGTYFPPVPAQGRASFAQVLDAVSDAWTNRRDEVESSAARVAEALVATSAGVQPGALPDAAALNDAVRKLAAQEDALFGGFGRAPKFPVAPILNFLLDLGGRGAGAPSVAEGAPERARALAARTLEHLAGSPLRDRVDGGFFRYAVGRDWSEPHYERMLYDNAQLLEAYTEAWKLSDGETAEAERARGTYAEAAEGIARFLTGVMQLADGGFASAQDSESTVDGVRVEGGYYALDPAARLRQVPPARDEKVLTGWNGLAIGALARAGFAFERPEWLDAARRAAEYLLARHLSGGILLRASIAGRVSAASATLEDYGMFAGGLFELALATGEVRFAEVARGLVDAMMRAAGEASVGAEVSVAGPAVSVDAADVLGVPPVQPPFAVPGGADPVLRAQGLAVDVDPSEGAYPSGMTAAAGAAYSLYLVTAERRYLEAARSALERVAVAAADHPLAFGGALRLMVALAGEARQLVVVTPGAEPGTAAGPLADAARVRPGTLATVVSDAQARAFAQGGFELFAGRSSDGGAAVAYLCQDFVCRLPVTEVSALPEWRV